MQMSPYLMFNQLLNFRPDTFSLVFLLLTCLSIPVQADVFFGVNPVDSNDLDVTFTSSVDFLVTSPDSQQFYDIHLIDVFANFQPLGFSTGNLQIETPTHNRAANIVPDTSSPTILAVFNNDQNEPLSDPVSLTVVPEPTSTFLGVVWLSAFTIRRRR